MLLSEKKLPFIAFLLVTWSLAAAAFFAGRWTTESEIKVVKIPVKAPTAEVIEVKPAEPAPATLTLEELAEKHEWDEAIARCDTLEERWSPACENVELILGRAIAEERSGSRLEAIGVMASKGLDFAPHNHRTWAPPNVSFTQDEVVEVTGWCALARQTQPEACRGLESMLAAGMFASGDVESVSKAYTKMRRMGVVPLPRLDDRHYDAARKAYAKNEFSLAVRHCEHGVEVGDERCVAVLALALEKLGSRRDACEVFAGIPDSELPFKCSRRAVSKAVLERMKRAYEVGEDGTINKADE